MATDVSMSMPVSDSAALYGNPRLRFLPGSSVKPSDQSLGSLAPVSLSLKVNGPGNMRLASCKRHLTVQAAYGSDGRPSSSSIFVGGFILGGVIVGTLGCIFAPKISQALAGADHKDLMRKLPNFIYDEERALERTRKKLEAKIAKLNSAIDNASAQIQIVDSSNGADVNSDEAEAAI
uniref:Localized to the inner membrane of the chloroplast n=1 Tax=Kalanchoe fedtschenkoi TaxID=63787 RepID=A0A7N0UMI7_KALFE